MSKQKDFVLKAERMRYAKDRERPTIRVSVEAYNALVDMVNESGLALSKVASQAIMYANDHLRYDRSGGECDGIS